MLINSDHYIKILSEARSEMKNSYQREIPGAQLRTKGFMTLQAKNVLHIRKRRFRKEIRCPSAEPIARIEEYGFGWIRMNTK